MIRKYWQSMLCLGWLFTAIPALGASCADLGLIAIDSVSISATEQNEAGYLSQNRAADLAYRPIAG